MSRTGYRKLTHSPAWGIYKKNRLVGSCRAASANEALSVFARHNTRHPELKITGDELKRIIG